MKKFSNRNSNDNHQKFHTSIGLTYLKCMPVNDWPARVLHHFPPVLKLSAFSIVPQGDPAYGVRCTYSIIIASYYFKVHALKKFTFCNIKLIKDKPMQFLNIEEEKIYFVQVDVESFIILSLPNIMLLNFIKTLFFTATQY